MRYLISIILFLCSSAVLADFEEDIVHVKSNHSVAATAEKLVAVLNAKGMKVFDRIDHSTGAKAAGLELPATELVIFGNPKVGTPLMQCARTVAIDLPQKALIWEDGSGIVWLSYNNPGYLKRRHQIEGCDEVLTKVSGALANFAKAATE